MRGEPPRLFAAAEPSLSAHLDTFGSMPSISEGLIDELEAAGLSGRGGAGFPTATKMRAVTGRKPVVVGNGAEGEPLSRKDVELLTRSPHLVLDGLDAAAAAINADTVYLYVHAEAMPPVATALDERRSAGLDPHRVKVVEAPDRFVAGEESAAIRRIEGGPALPRDRVVVSAVSGVRGRPTLVNNVETLAHVGLIARYGASWFRAVGDRAAPGTMLVTLSGALNNHGVVEVPTGVDLTELIESVGATDADSLSAVLVGGYHGTWIPAAAFGSVALSRTGLESLGASPGAGIVHGLGVTECGIARTAEVARYLADESARQCGPCLNGLPLLAESLHTLAYERSSDHVVKQVLRLARLVNNRGSCRHPDGTARMIRSALRTFAADVELHQHGRCTAADAAVDSSRGR